MPIHGKSAVFAFLHALALAPSAALAQVSIAPAAPAPQESVHVKVAPLPLNGDAFDPANRRITMSGSKVTIVLGLPGAVFLPPPPPTPALDIQIGQFPAGSYQVEVRRQTSDAGASEAVGSAAFDVAETASANAPLQNFTDLWWNPDESGWGVNLIQHGSGIIFATWFNYDADNTPGWYVVPSGQWARPTQYSGPIYRTSGPEVGETFDPALVTRTLVGQAVFVFSVTDSNRMTATFTVNGKTVSKVLQRQGF